MLPRLLAEFTDELPGGHKPSSRQQQVPMRRGTAPNIIPAVEKRHPWVMALPAAAAAAAAHASSSVAATAAATMGLTATGTTQPLLVVPCGAAQQGVQQQQQQQQHSLAAMQHPGAGTLEVSHSMPQGHTSVGRVIQQLLSPSVSAGRQECVGIHGSTRFTADPSFARGASHCFVLHSSRSHLD